MSQVRFCEDGDVYRNVDIDIVENDLSSSSSSATYTEVTFWKIPKWG